MLNWTQLCVNIESPKNSAVLIKNTPTPICHNTLTTMQTLAFITKGASIHPHMNLQHLQHLASRQALWRPDIQLFSKHAWICLHLTKTAKCLNILNILNRVLIVIDVCFLVSKSTWIYTWVNIYNSSKRSTVWKLVRKNYPYYNTGSSAARYFQASIVRKQCFYRLFLFTCVLIGRFCTLSENAKYRSLPYDSENMGCKFQGCLKLPPYP